MLKWIDKNKPVYLHGFSSALVRLAAHMKRFGVTPQHQIRFVHPTAVGLNGLHGRKLLEECFPNATVRMVYGSTEAHIASECEYGSMHLNETTCDIVETKRASRLQFLILSTFLWSII